MNNQEPNTELATLPSPSPIDLHYASHHAMPYGMAAEEAPRRSSTAIVHSLRRQWFAALILGLICAAPIAAAAWFLQQPKYTSSAYLRVSATDARFVFQTADQSGRFDFRTFKNTQLQLLLTPFVLNNALAREEISSLAVIRAQPDPINWLQKELAIDFPGDAEIMRVSLTSEDGAAAQKLVDAVVQAYTQEVIVAEQKDRTARLNNLEQIYSEAEGKVRSRRSELQRLADTLGTSDTDTLSLAQQGAVQQFGLVRNELTKTQFELMRAMGELKQLEAVSRPAATESTAPAAGPAAGASTNAPPTNSAATVAAKAAIGSPASSAVPTSSPPSPTHAIVNAAPGGAIAKATTPATNAVPVGDETEVIDPELEEMIELDDTASKLREEIMAIEDGLRYVREHLTDTAAANYRDQYKTKLDTLNRRLGMRKSQLQRQISGRSRGSSAMTGGSPLADVKLRVAVLQEQEAQLSQEVAKLDEEAKKFGRSSVDVEMMRAEIEGLDGVVRQVGSELERTRVEQNVTPRIALMSQASSPTVQDRKKQMVLAVALGLIGLVLPGGLLVWRDASRKHVNGINSVSDELGLNVLGSVPRISNRELKRLPSADMRADLADRQMEFFQDSVDSVAAMIMRRASLSQQQVILVSSATAGEGKSTLARHISASLASSGSSTLLVDFDLRRPTLHRAFGIPMSPGVGELLMQTVELSQAVKKTNTPELSVLSAGELPLGISRESSVGTLRRLFAELRGEFDFVVIDSGPVLPSADTRIVSQYADGVILSVLKDVSEGAKVVAAHRILREFGATILGTVVCGCAQDAYYPVAQNMITHGNS